jgi:hypothetical protein
MLAGVVRSPSSVNTGQDGITVRVVPCTLLGIGQNLVCRLDQCELLGCILNVVQVPVGMKFECFLSIGFPNPAR